MEKRPTRVKERTIRFRKGQLAVESRAADFERCVSLPEPVQFVDCLVQALSQGESRFRSAVAQRKGN